jgi:hypothetical protein
MLSRRCTALSIVIGILLAAAPMSAFGHTATVKSTVTLRAGYGYFQGKVGSPLAKCRANRTVKLFKQATGADPLLKTTTTNTTGAWAIFRRYEERTFYVKVPARIIRTSGHAHTCMATTSLLVAPPVRVTLSDGNGWSVSIFDCLQYAQDPLTAPPMAPIFVEGPGLPPLGFGSLQLIDLDTPFGFSFTDARWEGLDGTSLSSLQTIKYRSYVTGTAPPPIVKIYVDVTGDGSTTEEITFTPPDPAVAADQWQTWTAGRSATWGTPDGPMSLSDYQTANPLAEIKAGSFWGFRILSDCPIGGTQFHYLDAVTVQLTNRTMTFDFER